MFNITLPVIKPNVLAVKLSTTGERSVRDKHPWIFSDSVEKVNKEGEPGDIAIIFSHNKNNVMGVGLYDPKSPISIKMVHHDGGIKLDENFFNKKIKYAYSLRKSLLETNTNSYRLLFGENDGFPGFIADVYADVLVVKLYSAIWFPYLEMILKSLIKVSKVKTVVLRLSRILQQDTKNDLKDGVVLFGNLTNETIVFKEHGVNFSANVIKGHKTGYFLDHRENRKRVGEMSKNKRILDVFSYAGGFSIHALAKGAKEVTSLDISVQALELAKKNARLNKHSGSHKTIAGDAFNEMELLIKNNERFDVVVVDPPSFAKSQKEIVVALKKYRQLATLGVKLTARGGLLVLASCSSRISSAAFFRSNEKVLEESNRSYTTFLKTTHDVDHPVTFTEGSYLKCGYYKL